MNAAPKTLRHLSELEQAGLTAADKRAALEKVAAQYAVAITPGVATLIDPNDPHDPIARQFVPDPAELDVQPEERADPIGDHAHSPVEGIVHRYPDRVLLKLTHVCAVYCRFCFRREMIGPDATPLTETQIDAALAYIAAHPEIWEVVLTGGDPLVLSARRLKQAVTRLAAIPHVKVIRIHSRIPVADPARITPELVRALRAKGKATYVVLHANHARELTDAAREACARLIDAGIPMLSQSVLLAGVNDNPRALGELMRALVECRIKPYYLHHGDLATGTSHLRTSIEDGQDLMRALRGRLSGLCQPTYVLDIPGGHGKSPIGPNYLSRDASGQIRIEDFNGGSHGYPPAP
ncbi:MAG: lysine-2,3-aminomutase-like protein [Hyphomicrobiales bacterium]|nr:lysine-2,3-aminomutase-like protein [Alphaproteobacteria bacterium]